jgi:hypothetical protein
MVLLSTAAGCAPTGPTPPTPVMFVARCDHRACGPNESIVTREGLFECAAIGASAAANTARWPMVPAPTGTRRYVDPLASAGGDGSTEASALRTIAEAITAGAAEVILAQGTHEVSATIELTTPTRFVGAGAGAGGTTLRARSTGLFRAGVAVTVASVRVEGGSDPAFELTAGGALDAREVLFDTVATAVRARDAAIALRSVTVRRASGRAVTVTATAAGLARSALESVLVEDGQGPGIVFEGAPVDATRVSVRRQQRDGFALVGAGFTTEATLSGSSLACNGVTGLRAQGPGARLLARSMYIAGTTAPAGTTGGDGVFVHDGAQLSLDGDVSAPTDADQAKRSLVLDNARAGILADGRDATGRPSPIDLRIIGARVEANGASGLFLQRGARASLVGYSVFEANRALGVGLTTGSEVLEFRCDIFRGARAGTLATEPPVELGGDGLSSAGSTIGLVLASRFDDNGRFAAVFTQSSVGMFMANRGTNNGFTFGAYASTLVDTGNDIRGAAAPTTPPVTARDALVTR